MSELVLLRSEGSATRGVEASPAVMDQSGFIRSWKSAFTPAVATMSVTAVADAKYSVAVVDATCSIPCSRLLVLYLKTVTSWHMSL